MIDYVYYNEITEEVVLIDYQTHQKFGFWFYPYHNIILLGEL